ncbi:MAG: hypothetical protein OXR67_08130 [Chloroflexota bacterium]|nr:hypothetical protein [Chloroflexota bacterium]
MQNQDSTDAFTFLTQKLEDIEQQIVHLKHQRDSVTELLAEIKPQQPTVDKAELPSFLQDTGSPNSWDTTLSEINVDFTQADNLIQKIFLVFVAANKAGKMISTSAVGDYLLENGASRASQKNIRGTVGRTISEYRNHFEEVDTRIYRYIPNPEEEPLQSFDK